jgi:hypothetical protein
MNYTIITLVFIILMMMYVMYVYATNTNLVSGVVKLTEPGSASPILWTKLTNPGATTYHYEGWLYIKQVPTGKKCVFYRGDAVGNADFALILEGKNLSVCKQGKIQGGVQDDSVALTVLANVTTDFPLQKWVYFVVNVVNNNIIETYLNGKLINTKQLQGTTLLNVNTKSPVYIGGASSCNGYLTKFKREPSALTPDDVWKRYLEGNGISSLSNWLAGYNASFSVYNATEEVKKYTLF